MQAAKAGDWKSPPLGLAHEWSLWASVVRFHLFPPILPSSRNGTDNRLWLCVMQVRTLPRQPLYDYARSYKTLSSGAPVIRMLCIKNIRERNCRDSAALCVRLAHNRKVGNFRRGSYLGIAQLAERVFWEHEVAGSKPVTQTSLFPFLNLIWRDNNRQIYNSVRTGCR